jgi:formylglycine-generating enzyme required for sulfatase activity
MKVLAAGSFMMGSQTTEAGGQSNELPQHLVTIAKPFAVSQYEVTFDDWDACAATADCNSFISDGGFGRGTRPVINVSWDDATHYVDWLSKSTGKPYRLLTEAEYEYAARAGTISAYPWGNDIGKANANCANCGSQWDNATTAPVGSFAANAFGLFDMVGNVWEWVEDCQHDNYAVAPFDGSAWIGSANCNLRVIRGGSWFSPAPDLRSARRDQSSSVGRNGTLGFRVARTLDE